MSMKSNIKFGQKKDIERLMALERKVSETLKNNHISSYFGGLDKEEIEHGISSAPGVLIAEKESEDVLGFAIVQRPTEEEKKIYQEEFQCLEGSAKFSVLNGILVDPENQGEGIGKKIMNAAKNAAKITGAKYLVGTIHPENVVSKNVILSIAKQYEESDIFICTMKDGRALTRVYFCIEI